jgi:hypothetical protein
VTVMDPPRSSRRFAPGAPAAQPEAAHRFARVGTARVTREGGSQVRPLRGLQVRAASPRCETRPFGRA